MLGIGEIAALSAAFLWTISSLLWGQINLSALGLNLCKNVLGSLLVLGHLAALLLFSDRIALFLAPAESWFWLGLSGLVGVVIGDTVYFRSLQIMGARRALIMATTGPIFAAVLGWCFLDESLTKLAMTGILFTVAGVLVVVVDRKAKQEEPGLMPGRLRDGILLGLVGAVCQSVGGLFSKLGMRDGNGNDLCDAAEATFIRLLIAAVLTLGYVVIRRQLGTISRNAVLWKNFRLVLPATAVGTWLGIWMSQIAYQYSNIAIAQTLLATCPLFAIPIVWMFEGHRITVIGIVGTIVAFLGIYLTVH